MFAVGLRTQEIERQVRRMSGRFSSYAWVRNAHVEAGLVVAGQMQRVLEAQVAKRAAETGFNARSTRHLRSALLHPDNVKPLRGTNWLFGFQVGIPRHLDSTPAKPYWRNLEEGTGVFVGRPLLFFGPGTPAHTGLRDLTKRGGSRARDPSTGRFRAFRGRVVRVYGREGAKQRLVAGYHYMDRGGTRGLSLLVAGGRMEEIYGRYAPKPFRTARGRFAAPGRLGPGR